MQADNRPKPLALASPREPHAEIPAPSHWTNNNPFSDRLVQSTICCNAEARGVLQDLSYPRKDYLSSHLQEDATTLHSEDNC